MVKILPVMGSLPHGHTTLPGRALVLLHFFSLVASVQQKRLCGEERKEKTKEEELSSMAHSESSAIGVASDVGVSRTQRPERDHG
jgi:hypothetical protein